MANSMNDLANKIASMESQTAGGGLTSDVIFDAGQVNSVFLAVGEWNDSASGAISVDVNGTISTSDIRIYYANYNYYNGSTSWDSGDSVPAGTYKVLTYFNAASYGLVLMMVSRLS